MYSKTSGLHISRKDRSNDCFESIMDSFQTQSITYSPETSHGAVAALPLSSMFVGNSLFSEL